MQLPFQARSGDLFVAAVMILSQWAIFRYLLRDWKPRVQKSVWYGAVCLLAIIWVVAGFGLVMQTFVPQTRDPDLADLRTFTVGVQLMYGSISCCAVAVYALYRHIVDGRELSPTRRAVIRSSATALMLAPAVAGGYGVFIERKRFHVKEIDLPVPGLHRDLANIRMVQISDLHVSPYLSVADTARVVAMANELKADIALVTGDIISDFGDPLEEAIQELGRLKAVAGVYGCHGNHEIYARCQNRATALCARQGIDILRSRARQLRFGGGVLNLAGVDYQRIGKRSSYLKGAESMVVAGTSNILLSHSPDVFPVAVEKGFDAVLSGHTHGGQVTVEYLNQTLNLARFFTPYVSGLYRIDSRSCYVTDGVGTIGMPIRLGARPEISLLRLRPA